MTNLNSIKALQFFQLFRVGVALLIGFVLVKSGASLEKIASFESFLFVSSFLSFFWINGVLKSMLSLYAQKDENEKKNLITQIAILLGIVSLFIGIIVFGTGFFAEDRMLIPFYGYLCLFILFSSIGALGDIILVVKEEAQRLFFYGIIVYAIEFVIVCSVILIDVDIIHIIQSLVFWAFLRFLYSLYLISCYGNKKIDLVKIKMVFLFSLPLIGDSLVGNAMEYIDGGLVKYFFSEEMFAVYRYGARELPLSILFIGAIGTAIIPILTNNMTEGIDQLKEELTKVMKWLFPLSIVLMICSPYLFTYIYSDQFLVSSNVFNIYLLVITSRVLMPQVILLSKQNNYVLLWMSLIELILNFGLSILFIQLFGLNGIPFASVISYLVVKFLMISYVWHTYKISLRSYINYKIYIPYSILIIISYYFSTLYT